MRKVLLGGIVAVTMLATAGAALGAESSSGSREGRESEPYACPTEEAPLPAGQPAPDADDCQGGETTYTVWVYDNQVDCGGDHAAPTPALDGDLGGDPAAMQGYGEICADESNTAAPIQGRIIVDGSQADGINVAVDGDADNAEPGDGWIRVHLGSAPSVSCGDSEGNLDSQTRTDADTQDDCDPQSE